MAKPMKVQIITKDGKHVTENCHDITTCREHREGVARAKKFAITGVVSADDLPELKTVDLNDLMSGMDLSNDFADVETESINHKEILERKGFKIDSFETFGSYQGDYAAIVEKDGKVGFVVIGYGSCSGCDALDAIKPSDALDSTYDNLTEEEKMETFRGKLQDYANHIENSVKYGSYEELKDAITGEDGRIKWYSEDKGFEQRKESLLNSLEKAYKK